MLIDWFTVFAQTVNFLILVFLLKRFLYKPVLDALETREKGIAAQITDAQKISSDAQKSKQEFEHKNRDFDSQLATRTVEAVEGAKKEREQLIEKARKDSGELRLTLNQAVTSERESFKKRLRSLVQQQVISITRKALHDLADTSLEEQMACGMVHQLQDMKEPARERFAAILRESTSPVIVRSSVEMAGDQRTAISNEVNLLCGNGYKLQLEFEIKPSLVSGIELLADGQKIGWNIDQYLAALDESMDQLFNEKVATTTKS